MQLQGHLPEGCFMQFPSPRASRPSSYPIPPSCPLVSVTMQIRLIYLLASPKIRCRGETPGRGKRGSPRSNKVYLCCQEETLLCETGYHVFVCSVLALTQSRCSANAYCARAEHFTPAQIHSPPFSTLLCPRAWPLRIMSQSSLALWLLAGFSQRKHWQEIRGRRKRWVVLHSLPCHRLAAAAFLPQRPQLPS